MCPEDLDTQLKVLGVQALLNGWHPSWVRVYTAWIKGESTFTGKSAHSQEERLKHYRLNVDEFRRGGHALPASVCVPEYRAYD